MSISIKIHTQQEINTDTLIYFLDLKFRNLKMVQKTKELFYFYLDKESLRGVDFEKQDGAYEIRRLSMFSEGDEAICRQIFFFAEDTLSDCHFSIDDEPISYTDLMNMPLVDFKDDLKFVKLMVKEFDGPVGFFGPTAEFHFGPNAFSKIDTEKEGWEEELVKIAYKVLYDYSELDNDYILSTGEGENLKLVKMINPETAYVIRKFDYIVFHTNPEAEDDREIILVTNEVLNDFLPESWELIDEYTIMAPALSLPEYNSLVEKLLPFDSSDEVAVKD